MQRKRSIKNLRLEGRELILGTASAVPFLLL
jgi:hypothetical protein